MRQKVDLQKRQEILPGLSKKNKAMEIFESLESSLNELSDHPFVDDPHIGSTIAMIKTSPEPSRIIHKVIFIVKDLIEIFKIKKEQFTQEMQLIEFFRDKSIMDGVIK